MQITVCGTAFDLVIAGAGPPALYLHPEIGGRDSAAFVRLLAERFTVYAPSHPGYDGSNAPAHFRGVDDLAIAYLDLIDRLELDELTVVGVSMGAWIAAEMALRDSHRIRSMVFAAPVGAKFGERDRREIADLFSLTHEEFDGLAYADPAAAAARYAALDDGRMNRLAHNYEATARYAWLPYMYDPKLVHRLYRIARPALCLWGEQDRVTTSAYARSFADALPQGSYEEIAGAGHYPHVEQPAELVDRIVRFVEAQSSSPRFAPLNA